MSVLVAVLYAFSDMASSNEITAMSAGGVRPARIMAPVFGLGVVAMLVMLFFNDSVLPESNHALKNLLLDIGRKSPTLELREQVVNELTTGTGIDRYFLTADRIDHDTNRLENVTIFDANDPDRQRTTYAASGEMAFNDARTDLYLTLFDGVVHEVHEARSGEAWPEGPVVISWTASDEDANVIIHEFAHKLDLCNGIANGMPPLHNDMDRNEWTEVFTRAYEDFCTRVDRGMALPFDAYAATDAAEFFAVASEAFLLAPDRVRDTYPRVYTQLCAFYRQHPRAS